MSNGSPHTLPKLPLAVSAGVDSSEAAQARSFEAFFTEHRWALTAFLRRRTACEEDAQEITQESYLRVLQYGYGDSRPAQVWKALLYRIAENLAASQTRRNRVRNVAGQQTLDQVDPASEAPSQERLVLAEQELALIRQVLGELSPKCRKVFLLSRTHRKTYPEIAGLCGISVKMVEKYISQALAALRAKLGDGP